MVDLTKPLEFKVSSSPAVWCSCRYLGDIAVGRTGGKKHVFAVSDKYDEISRTVYQEEMEIFVRNKQCEAPCVTWAYTIYYRHPNDPHHYPARYVSNTKEGKRVVLVDYGSYEYPVLVDNDGKGLFGVQHIFNYPTSSVLTPAQADRISNPPVIQPAPKLKHYEVTLNRLYDPAPKKILRHTAPVVGSTLVGWAGYFVSNVKEANA